MRNVNMKICPRCKIELMELHMKYNAGRPIMIWTCGWCGYDTTHIKYTVSNSININKYQDDYRLYSEGNNS